MPCSLVNRFQAVLLAAAIGETIGLSHSLANASEPDRFTTPSLNNPLPTLGLEPLTRLYTTSLLDPDRVESPTDPVFQACLTSAEMAVVLLPLALFFHEDGHKFKQHLQATLKVWQQAQVSDLSLEIIAYTIAQGLAQTLQPTWVISQFLNSSLWADPTTTLATAGFPQVQELRLIEECVEQRVGLSEVIQLFFRQTDTTDPLAQADLDAVGNGALEKGEPPTIVLALYCFLSTDRDFRLSLLRALRIGRPWVTPNHNPLPALCALTAALSAAHNGTVGIPMDWRLAMQEWQLTHVMFEEPYASAHTMTQSALLQLSTQLFSQWSGLYDPATVNQTVNQHVDSQSNVWSGVMAPRRF